MNSLTIHNGGSRKSQATQVAPSSDMSLQLVIFIFKNIALNLQEKIAPCLRA